MAFLLRLPTVPESENKPRLQLKRSGWVDVGECWDCIRCRTNTADNCRMSEQASDRHRSCYAATEKVTVIEKIEAFQPEQNARPFRCFDPTFNERCDIRSWCSTKC